MADNEDLLDYEDEEQTEAIITEGNGEVTTKEKVKGTYVSIHSSGFRDFLLKPEILRAIVDCGFEHPSEGDFKYCFEIIINDSQKVTLPNFCYIVYFYY